MDLFSVLTLIGGLAFFLFGMNTMSASLEKMAGGKLEHSLQKVTSSPLLSITLGAAITIAVQSSSATTVMLVGLVNSGIMSFAQTIYVIFGSNIGTTLTSWILGLSSVEGNGILIQMLKPENFSPILAFVGIILIMLSKKEKNKSIGTVFVGFAILMYGMNFMSDSVSSLKDMPGFSEFLIRFSNPFVLIIIGTLITAVIQSSAASVGILQALSLTGSVTNAMAIPIVMGQNIGTCVTALISSIGTGKKAKRVAFAHVLFNAIGTVFCLGGYLLFDSIFHFAFSSLPTTPFSIALFHSIFNLITTAVLLPFAKKLVVLVEKILPEQEEETKKASPVFLDERLLRSPSVAISELSAISNKMCKLSEDIVRKAMTLTEKYDKTAAEEILRMEDELDIYEDKLGTYLVKLSTKSVSRSDSRTIARILHAIGDFERLGDHAVNLLKTADEIHQKKLQFSPSAAEELIVLRNAIEEICHVTASAYISNDVTAATGVEPLEQVIDHIASSIKSHHIDRLQHGDCTIELGFVLSDLLTNYERISDHCSNIAVAVIEEKGEDFDTHAYLNGVKYGSPEFTRIFDGYMEKYRI